jgi:pantoate--beta-alanine ligase
MVKDLEIPIKIHIMPTIRNSEGLALSSRNQYLSDSERSEALILPQTLQKIAKLLSNNESAETLIKESLTDKRWDYLEVLDSDTLEAPTEKSSELLVVAAFRLGQTRLLDNILVTKALGN